jgi:parallel beta-helix repeat protein
MYHLASQETLTKTLLHYTNTTIIVKGSKMKRVYSGLTLLLILCSLPIPTLSVTWIPEVKGAEQGFFEENFESYNVGTFPSSGGWKLWYNGAGIEQQIIVDNVSVSPTKSLKLLSLDSWAGFAAKQFTSTSSTIGFEVAVRVEENNGHSRDDARVAFTTKVSDSISREYAPVTFQDSGVITSGGQVLQSYFADKWYKIKVIMNRTEETYSVWVDGELKGENLAVTTTSGDITDYPSYEIEAFSVSQCFNSVTAYFDDVKVFEDYEVNPRLELVPNKGIEKTTLMGSWFAHNSKISVTWNDKPVTTTPSSIIADGYGNFTAMISVLDQTAGTYTVKAVDGMGNEATATFTVTLSSPSQTHTVPDDYPTIQEAINSAADGDTIFIREGTYNGDLNITKHISLKGQNPESTIINGCIVIRTSNVTIDSVKLIGFGRWAQLKTFIKGYGISTLSGKPHSLGSRQEIWGTTVTNCVFENWIIPISLMSGDGERVENNTILNCDQGIDVDTFDNVIAHNTISCDGNGISLASEYISGNLVYGNYISGAERGIVSNWFNHDNDIIGNTISGCQEGIHLGAVPEGYGPCSDNTIFHNNFISNIQQVFLGDGSSDTWDNGYRSGGNYWSDYNGVDYNGDGIGDVPYVIDENNRDNYPLMAPWNSGSGNGPTGPNTWTVDDDGPADFHTIQEAINAADDGDTVLVYSGTYCENVIVNKTLTVKSQSGAENTIVCTPDPETGKNVFEITADNVELAGFTIKDSTTRTIQGDPFNPSSYVDACGIYTATCTGTKITRNIVKNNFEGIVIVDSSDILVSENQITGNIHEGIRLAYSTSATVIKNNIIGNHFPRLSTATGLVFYHCSNSTVTENQIVANNNGAVVNNSHDITVSSNNITANGFHGLNLVSSYGNTVFGNIMKKNTYGICPSGSTGTQIYENILQENEDGIACYGASNNFVYHNCFINNSRQVSNFHGTETNSYDNGYRSGGNYWSDYNGVDYNGDGIGETPYIIDENNRDNYPLMSPNIVNSSPSHQSTGDTAPPNITDVSQAPVSVNGTLEEGVRVTATVTDAAGEVERVALKYSDGNGTWVTVEMTKVEGDVWVGIIPAFPHGTNVTYTIIAEDKAGNTVTTEEQPGDPNQYDVLPEFPLWIGLPLFLIAAASTLVVRKRASSPVFTKICNRVHRLLT